MSEPMGLNMSLDDLIKKKGVDHNDKRSVATARGGGTGGNLGTRGGIQKHPGNKTGNASGRGGGRGQQHQQHYQQHHQQNQHQDNRGSYGGQQRAVGGRSNGGRFGPGDRQHQHHHQRQQAYGGNRQAGSAFRAEEKHLLEPTCFLDEDTGDVVVSLKQTDVIRVSPGGDIVLNTDGWYTESTLEAMNRALNVLQIAVSASGDVGDGRWSVRHGGHLLRFQDGMVLNPRNPATGPQRGPAILAAMRNPAAATAAATMAAANVPNPLAAAASAASAAAAAAVMARAKAALSMGALGMGAASMMGGMGSLPFQAGLMSAQNMLAANAHMAGMTADGEAVLRRLKAQGRLS